MGEVLTEQRVPIGNVLQGLEDEDMRVYAWRLYTLERAGFGVSPAIEIARCRDVDLRLAERMKAQGCSDTLVAKILT